MTDVKQPESVQQAVERLREAEADRVRRGFIYLSCEPEMVATVIAALEAAELKIAAAPQVQCDCHPGVRWPTSEWGKPCALSAALLSAEVNKNLVRRLREALEMLLNHPSDNWRDATDVPHATLGVATLTPLQIAEKVACAALAESAPDA